MVASDRFESWWNARGLDPNHPLYKRLREFSDVGADLDIVWPLCVRLAVANGVHCQLVEFKKTLASRKRRWTKEFRALCSTHTGGKLRLTEAARHYTDVIIRTTVAVLKAKGILDSATELSVGDVAEIKQQALEPFANMQGYAEDWDHAIDNTPLIAQNLFAAVGASKITREQGESIKSLVNLFSPAVFQSGATKRRDDAGTIFLLLLTEHLREATHKPRMRLAFTLMRSLQDKSLKSDGNRARKNRRPDKSAAVRVARLKQQWPAWPAEMTRLKQIAELSKVN